MSRLHGRLSKLEAACRPPVPDIEMEARFQRAIARMIAQLEMALPAPSGPARHGGDPARLLAEAERRLQP